MQVPPPTIFYCDKHEGLCHVLHFTASPEKAHRRLSKWGGVRFWAVMSTITTIFPSFQHFFFPFITFPHGPAHSTVCFRCRVSYFASTFDVLMHNARVCCWALAPVVALFLPLSLDPLIQSSRVPGALFVTIAWNSVQVTPFHPHGRVDLSR